MPAGAMVGTGPAFGVEDVSASAAAPVLVALGTDEVAAAFPLVAVLQTISLGRLVTCWVLHMACANSMVSFCCSALQFSIRQHAIWPRKSWFSQMHLTSSAWQPAI